MFVFVAFMAVLQTGKAPYQLFISSYY